MARFSRAQLSSQVLASIAMATVMLVLVASYAATQRQISVSQTSPIPLSLRHAKADIDADFHTLFCDAGLCISSTHNGDATLSFAINAHSGLFPNLSNFTKSYSGFFSSARQSVLSSSLSSMLDGGYVLLGESATGSNLSVSDTGAMKLNFNSSSVLAYSFVLGCANTTEITWSPAPGSGMDINWSLSLPGYSEDAPLGINRSLNYSTSFGTTCGEANVSILLGSLYANYSHQNASLNVAVPTNNSVGVFPLLNKTTVLAPGSAFSLICLSGKEPTYPSTVSGKSYGSFMAGSGQVNFILANLSGAFNAAYFDANGNCNFTDFTDEYFTAPGEWVNLGGSIAKLESIFPDGSGATLEFASAGVEVDIMDARLAQPIHLNKPERIG